MNAETITSTASAMKALGITGVSIGLLGLVIVMGVIMYFWIKRSDARDKADIEKNNATAKAMDGMAEHLAAIGQALHGANTKIDGAANRQVVMESALNQANISLAEIKARLSS